MAKKKAKPVEKPAQKRPVTWTGHLIRAWKFVWEDDSLASLVVNIALAFILIKFLFYPALGLVMGTGFPVVAVVSSSMEHHPGDFDTWWTLHEDEYLRENVTRLEFNSFPFRDGFNKGDIMVLIGTDAAKIKKGEVIVYWSGKPYPIIHRYLGTNVEEGRTFLMSKGDNNARMITCPANVPCQLDERRILEERLLGKAVGRIPWLGWVKIVAVNAFDCTLHGVGDKSPWNCVIEGRTTQ